jgi:hypothetical protein
MIRKCDRCDKKTEKIEVCKFCFKQLQDENNDLSYRIIHLIETNRRLELHIKNSNTIPEFMVKRRK